MCVTDQCTYSSVKCRDVVRASSSHVLSVPVCNSVRASCVRSVRVCSVSV